MVGGLLRSGKVDSMGWLSRLLGAASKEDMQGMTLEDPSAWQVSLHGDPSSFFRALPFLLPAGAVLYFEGTSVVSEIEKFFQDHQVEKPQKVAMGTIWPRPKRFHVRASGGLMDEIARRFEKHAAPEICDHFHVYDEQGIILQWHDAFSRYPLYVAKRVDKGTLELFCSKSGCTIKDPEKGP